jgi:hypothetical protein
MREDRDRFVKILFKNILPGGEKNFQLQSNKTHSYKNTPFDFHSVMNYGSMDFGRDDNQGGRMTTIETKTPGLQIR